MVTTLQIQRRLAELRYDPGSLDGIRGRRTIRAIREFQKAAGLAEDGIAGPITRAKLFAGSSLGLQDAQNGSSDSLTPDLPWFEEARRLLGTNEFRGGSNNPVILDWAQDLHIWYPGDDIPWCGLFAAHCVGLTLPDEDLPKNPLLARNWRRFGRSCEPTQGCVLVFWRTHPTNSPNGHVGFYAGEDAAHYFVLGGNQSDKVSIARLEKTRLLEARFPATAPLGERKLVDATLETAANIWISTEEA